MGKLGERIQGNVVYSFLFLVFFVFIIYPSWFVVAALEVVYMKCRGFDWDPHEWGYINWKTGERVRNKSW
jgi:hypothetical protein